ncbi:hypothetical protein Trisim1_011933 [Trichoderma cf. simile WF8]
MRLSTSVLVAATASVPVSGLQGFGDQSTGYFPYCATACNRALGSNYLSCSFDGYVPGGMMDSDSASATPACRGSNMPFLSSLAYCISTHCNYDMGIIETWWAAKSTGSGGAFEPPRWSYQEALMNVTIAPTHVITAKDNFTSTMLANETNYRNQYGTLFMVDREEFLHEKYGLVLFMVGFGIPLLATWLGYIPFVSPLIHKLKPYITWPSIIGSYRIRQLRYLGGTALTRGQALYVFIMVVLTVVFMAVHCKSYQPNLWYPGLSVELMAYVVWRTGCYSLALLPVVLPFSARNNTLLWLTHWSHETYILLHRWVARIFALVVIIHSILSIVYYVKDGNYDVNLVEAWWIWGCVGTIAISAMLITATSWVRSYSYEFFLVSHIVLAVFVLAGTWYHLFYLYLNMSGYEKWLYVAFGIWGLDRLFRVFRILKNGVQRAHIINISDDIVRVDIDGIHWGFQPGKVVYAYFPTLQPLRPWENHPFSVLPTAMLERSNAVVPALDKDTSSSHGSGCPDDIEKTVVSQQKPVKPVASASERQPTAGITLFIRKSTGLTKALAAGTDILTLLDGPYPGNPIAPISQCDRVLLVCGGIGITAILPWVDSHPNVKLAWSVKEYASPLVDSVRKVLDRVVEKDLRIGHRLDIEDLLMEEAQAGWKRIGVVACGPDEMCDDTRALVTAVAKRGEAQFELEVHAYSW